MLYHSKTCEALWSRAASNSINNHATFFFFYQVAEDLGFDASRQFKTLGVVSCDQTSAIRIWRHRVFADIIWRRSALNPKDCRCFWCPLIFNCLSNCHPSLLSFDCLYIISFFCPPPLFPLPFTYLSHSSIYISDICCLSSWHCFPSSVLPSSFYPPPLLTSPRPLVPLLSSDLFSILAPRLPPTPPPPSDVARYCGCEERCSDSEMCHSAES